jgi:hypothetical protein
MGKIRFWGKSYWLEFLDTNLRHFLCIQGDSNIAGCDSLLYIRHLGHNYRDRGPYIS